jgi:hypothetical protein
MLRSSTVMTAIGYLIVSRLYSSAYGIRPHIPRYLTVRPAIDPLVVKTLLTSTCEIRPSTLYRSSVRLVIDHFVVRSYGAVPAPAVLRFALQQRRGFGAVSIGLVRARSISVLYTLPAANIDMLEVEERSNELRAVQGRAILDAKRRAGLRRTERSY